MERPPQSKETYDRIFSEGGYGGSYNLPYWHSVYYPLFKAVLKAIRRHGANSVLEVGCGTGGFAQLLMEKSSLAYRGFDFSDVAVEKSRARTGRPEAFYVGDATSPDSYAGPDYDCIVCTEVLEHIPQDLAVIEHWKIGAFCQCSVPTFDAETHVRYFKSEEQVRERYGKLIDIQHVGRIKKPAVSNLSLVNVLRELRWNRYRPKQLMAILGLGSFDVLGGWYLVSGTRRT